MSEAKHTPGPWWIETGPDVDLINHVGISADDHSMLAQAVWKMDDDERSPMCEANAHLIAAAPDLLDALQSIVASAEDGCAAINTRFLITAKAAIAKATGKTS
jgi:hypothetical protein